MINLQETFDKFEYNFSEFDKVVEKYSNRPDLHAFILLDKLVPSDNNIDIIGHAELDYICLDIDLEKLAEVATEDDILTLRRCGVRYDEYYDSLMIFV